MLSTFIRLIIIYFFTVLTIRIMGKRQIGELQMSELVTAFFLSELAVLAITDSDIPILHGILPVISVIVLEVIISFLSIKIPLFKKIFDNSPSYLITKGKINQKELERSRITTDELISQLRLSGTTDPDEVNYAILEPSGQISVTPKSAYRPPNTSEMNMSPPDPGIIHIIISDGKINEKVLSFVGRDQKWLQKKLRDNKISSTDDIFLFTVNDNYECRILLKDKRI